MKKLWKHKFKNKGIWALCIILFVSLGFSSINDKDFKIAKNLDIFVTLFREINLFYVDDKDPEDLIEASINGMLKSLDPYTSFIPESDKDEYKFMTTGQYGGIGALIRKAGEYTIISDPYEGFPAQKTGLMAGDTILSINGISTKGKNIEDVSDLLKGTPNTEVILKIKRYGDKEPREYTFLREKVTIKNVPYFDMITEDIGYIRLGNFHENASSEVNKALADLKKRGAVKIIIDVRNNPGGLLKEAVDIAALFVEQGQEIVSTKGKVKQWDKKYTTESNPIDTSIQMAILVNRSSASASEILAGAMQDLDRAIIIGQRTFGKGLVQVTRPLSYNTQLKITTAKYYIPSGRCIQAVDYSHRNEDGSVGHIPDSLISEFSTLSGRKVYDGGGIEPDVKVDFETPGSISINLFTQNMFFDYATIFAVKNENIENIAEFNISEEEFEKFKNFIESKDFSYNTASSEKLDELIEIAKEEKYYSLAKDEFDAIEKELKADLTKDLETFQDEIRELLEEEIISRYYYERGRIESAISHDPQVDKAVEVLNDKNLYSSILSGSGEIVPVAQN